jgi:myo-inositol 2-dehydrogenase/D-chiro-inositol 1-dehydrogenase
MTLAGNDISVAVVGLGSMGWRHAATLARMPGVRLAAVADPVPERLGGAHDAWGAATYASWEELLERAAVDALFVCTPPLAHAAPALAALERRLAVFVEKPIARGLEEAHALVEAQRAAGTVAAMGYQWRAIDFLDEVRSGLADQRVGLLTGRSIGQSRSRPWFVDWEQGGGVLLELASHDIDLQRALAGEVVSVQAAATDVPIAAGVTPGVASVLSLTLRFRAGALGAVQVAWLADGLPTSWALDVVTDSAAYYIALDPTFTLTGMSNGRPLRGTVAKPPSEANIEQFIRAVRAGDPAAVCCTLEEGAKTLAVSLACDRALATMATVNVDEGVFA